MRIKTVTAHVFDLPMRAPYRSAQRITTTAHNVLVRVETSDGLVGLGESSPAKYVTGETQASVLEAVKGIAAQIDDSETATEIVAEKLSNQPGARGAVEMAIADLFAQSKNVPLCRLWNPDANVNAERITDLSLPILRRDEIAVRAHDAIVAGFRTLKIKVGSGSIVDDIARVRAVADQSPDLKLRLDGNQGFTPDDAVRFVERLADLHNRIELLEQPTVADDDDALAFVVQRIGLPVFADEAAHNADDASRLVMQIGCAGIVLKVAKSGIAETIRTAKTTHQAGGICLLGCMMESRIGITASLHLAIALGASVVPYLDLDGHLLVDDADFVTGGLLQMADRLSLAPNTIGLGAMPTLLAVFLP